MEVALERACAFLPTWSEKNRVRRIVASKVIECAYRGKTPLSSLTEAGYVGAMQLAASRRPVRKEGGTPYRIISDAANDNYRGTAHKTTTGILLFLPKTLAHCHLFARSIVARCTARASSLPKRMLDFLS